jgi:uncharacterized paraquat-inducible protein A
VIVAVLGVGATAILAAALYVVRGVQSAESEVHYCRCAECSQKVRYAASRAGREALCPRCRQKLTLPAKPQPLAPLAVSPQTFGRSMVLRRTA